MRRQSKEYTALYNGGDAVPLALRYDKFLRANGDDHRLSVKCLSSKILHRHTVVRQELNRLAIGLGSHDPVKEIREADEGRDKDIGRTAVYLLRTANLTDNTALHDCDTIGDGKRFLLIVCNINGRYVDLPLDLLDRVAHLHTQLRIEIGERLIHEQNLRCDDNSTCERDTLLLPP